MSTIQEALKRAQKEKERRANPGFGPGSLSGGPGPRPRFRGPVVAAAVVVLAVAAWFAGSAFLGDPDREAPRPPAPGAAQATRTAPGDTPGPGPMMTQARTPEARKAPEAPVASHKVRDDSRDSRLRAPVQTDGKPERYSKRSQAAGETPPKVVSRVITPAAGGAEPLAEPMPEPLSPAPPAMQEAPAGEKAMEAVDTPAAGAPGQDSSPSRPALLSKAERLRMVGQLYEEGRKAQLSNDPKLARKLYEQAVTIAGGHAPSDNNLGVMDMAEGLLDEAEQRLFRASRLSPGFVDPVYNLACLFARKGDREKALTQLARAVAMDPTVAGWARQDPDFFGMKEMAEFSALVKDKAGQDLPPDASGADNEP